MLTLAFSGLARAHVSGAPLAIIYLPSTVYLGWRSLCAQVSYDGARVVRVRNGLRSYTLPTASIVGASVVSRRKLPPRLALKVQASGRTRLIALDATARMTRKGRAEVVRDLSRQTIIRPAVLHAFDTFKW